MENKYNFFFKIILSIIFTFFILFFIINSKNTDKEGYKNYFSKIISNTATITSDNVFFKKIKDWFSPSLKKDHHETFVEYKLTILSKNVDAYFKNLLKDTQSIILNQRLKKSIENSSLSSLKLTEDLFKKYIKQNSNIQETSVYNLKGKKLIGVKYKNIPQYIITDKLISELKNKNNLLLKHGKTDYLILLSLVRDNNAPFMIVSQTINPNFFNQILSHLEMKKELFYLKDSHNYVLLDNYREFKKAQISKKNTPFNLYQSLIDYNEKNLTIKLDNVAYSIGTIVEKNNLMGNLLASIFILFIFTIIFFSIERCFNIIKYMSYKINDIKDIELSRKLNNNDFDNIDELTPTDSNRNNYQQYIDNNKEKNDIFNYDTLFNKNNVTKENIYKK